MSKCGLWPQQGGGVGRNHTPYCELYFFLKIAVHLLISPIHWETKFKVKFCVKYACKKGFSMNILTHDSSEHPKFLLWNRLIILFREYFRCLVSTKTHFERCLLVWWHKKTSEKICNKKTTLKLRGGGVGRVWSKTTLWHFFFFEPFPYSLTHFVTMSPAYSLCP